MVTQASSVAVRQGRGDDVGPVPRVARGARRTRDGLSTLAELAKVAVFVVSDNASGLTRTTVNLSVGSLDD
jgi:hypothetical protein